MDLLIEWHSCLTREVLVLEVYLVGGLTGGR